MKRSELERLRDLSVQSALIETQIADLEREWLSCRQSEARLNSEELMAIHAVASLKD